MSVLTATKSTWVIPASIMRSTAFRPAPPTPTTRKTARYDALSRALEPRALRAGSGAPARALAGLLRLGIGCGRDSADRCRLGLGRQPLLPVVVLLLASLPLSRFRRAE